MKRRLYVDGNTVYGIDEECIKKKQGMGEKEQENYLALLLCASLRKVQRLGRSSLFLEVLRAGRSKIKMWSIETCILRRQGYLYPCMGESDWVRGPNAS